MHNPHVTEDTVKKTLRVEDARFAELERAHRQLDEALMRYELHVYLSPEDEQQRRELQKRKLALKDQMARLVRQQLN